MGHFEKKCVIYAGGNCCDLTRNQSKHPSSQEINFGPEIMAQSSLWEGNIFSFGKRRSRSPLGPSKSPIHWVPNSFAVGKSTQAWIWLLLLYRAEVKNARSFTSTSPYALMAWRLIEQREIFTLYNINTQNILFSRRQSWEVTREAAENISRIIQRYNARIVSISIKISQSERLEFWQRVRVTDHSPWKSQYPNVPFKKDSQNSVITE
jgi:hypothetical protein